VLSNGCTGTPLLDSIHGTPKEIVKRNPRSNLNHSSFLRGANELDASMKISAEKERKGYLSR
jgi:hypothetical protein